MRKIKSENKKIEEMVLRRKELKDMLSPIEKELKSIDADLKKFAEEKIMDEEGVSIVVGRATFGIRLNKSTKFITKKLKEELPDVYEKYAVVYDQHKLFIELNS